MIGQRFGKAKANRRQSRAGHALAVLGKKDTGTLIVLLPVYFLFGPVNSH